jgi:5-methyltetrahydropteroyltriglutamate--homocysteine methyltransferase
VSGAPPRAEVIGSLLRPERVRRAREQRAAGRLGPAEFKRIEDAEVDRAIALQEGAGLRVVTDGEMRRAHFTGAVSETVDGLGDVPAAERGQVGDLLGASICTYSQPELATLVDPAVREGFEQRGIDPGRMLGEGLEILNGVTGTPRVHHAIHLCRGNRDGHWMASGGYDAISKEVFTRATGFQTFFLEYDDERSGGFEPLGDLPQDRTVVLGLVSTKRTELEDAGALLQRIDEAARFSPRDQLGVSPQCGFESAIGDYPLDEEQQERKLRLVVEVAERAGAA